MDILEWASFSSIGFTYRETYIERVNSVQSVLVEWVEVWITQDIWLKNITASTRKRVYVLNDYEKNKIISHPKSSFVSHNKEK